MKLYLGRRRNKVSKLFYSIQSDDRFKEKRRWIKNVEGSLIN